MLALSTIKNGLPHSVNAKIYGNCVMCRDPAANYRLKWKNTRRTITIYPHGDNDIRVNCHNGQDYAEVKDWVRSQLGIAWKK
jgi:hypothetical protein